MVDVSGPGSALRNRKQNGAVVSAQSSFLAVLILL